MGGEERREGTNLLFKNHCHVFICFKRLYQSNDPRVSGLLVYLELLHDHTLPEREADALGNIFHPRNLLECIVKLTSFKKLEHLTQTWNPLCGVHIC